MAKVIIVLDKRTANKTTKSTDKKADNADKQGLYPIKLRVSAQGSNTSVSTGISVSEDMFVGDPECAIEHAHPKAKQINQNIQALYYMYVNAIMELERSGKIQVMSAADIRDYVNRNREYKVERTFTSCLTEYKEQCRTEKTQQGFDYTLQTLERFRGKQKFFFEEINYQFLSEFDKWMESNGMGLSTRGIIYRNMRTVYNYAINNDWVDMQSYPFRKFKIKQSKKEKVYLPEDKMRALLTIDLSHEQGNGLELARDFFVLSFLLCGINPIDLYNLPQQSERITFVRQKVKFHEPYPIHIGICSEAQYLISQHKGQEHLINLAEKYQSFESCYHFMKHRLKKLGKMIGCPDITFYWARYSWATYASKIDVSDSTISKALGHADSTLAEKRYISFDWSKVDKANRRVIDYVFYNEV